MEATIGGNAYQHNRVNQWTTSIVEQCLSQLSKLGKPFKYICMWTPTREITILCLLWFSVDVKKQYICFYWISNSVLSGFFLTHLTLLYAFYFYFKLVLFHAEFYFMDLFYTSKCYKIMCNLCFSATTKEFPNVFFFLILLSSLVLLVTCVIMQKNGAGMQTASTCFWDNSTDGKDKNTCVFLM